MRYLHYALAFLLIGIAAPIVHVVHAFTMNEIMKGGLVPSSGEISDNGTIASGLKEALSIGTATAINNLSSTGGYFGNEAIRILMPEKMQRVADLLKKAGYSREIDAFILSMNKAAEKAAPKAKPIFIDAIKEMSFEDAKKILNGESTAATDYFKSKTSSNLFDAFKPEISSSMNEAGVTHAFKAMTERYTSILPFAKPESLDLDNYVTNKALDGLFYTVSQEEEKIRTDPSARTTEILKKVFGR